MSETVIRFNLISDNPFWDILKKANDFHVSRRDQYQVLTDTLKAKGVAFKDIKNHLLNEAKKCGLYTRSMWSDTQKTMVFRTWSDLRQCKYAWVIALNNYLVWLHSNLKDYGVRKDRIAKKNTPVVKKQTIVRKTTDSQTGAVKEVKTETVSTSQDVPVDRSLSGWSETILGSGIVAPITQDLTVLQKQTLILQNLGILGNICKEKGAVKEFNLLMTALGSIEYVIEN